MRTALGLCLVVALFALAALWHAGRGGGGSRAGSNVPGASPGSHTAPGTTARAGSSAPRSTQRERGIEAPELGPPLPPPGWVEIVLGAPSGAEPLEVPVWYLPQEEEPLPRTDDRGRPPLAPRATAGDGARFLAPSRPPDFELEVEPGQVLSRIAEHHYGTSRPALVQALAVYNGLASPDKLKQGQVLRLPPIEVLEAERP